MSNDGELAYARVCNEAALVYRDRDARYGSMWQSMSRDENAMHVESKWRRLQHLSANGHEARDDAIDMLNYLVFYIANGHADG